MAMNEHNYSIKIKDDKYTVQVAKQYKYISSNVYRALRCQNVGSKKRCLPRLYVAVWGWYT